MPAAKDYSANQPTLPVIGGNFAASGPYASFALIATANQNALRKQIEVENTSGAEIAVLIDDGTAAAGAAPVGASIFSLAGGGGAGQQGGSWQSSVEKGRIQLFAVSGAAQVFMREN